MNKNIYINLKMNKNSKETMEFLSNLKEMDKKFNYVIFVNYLNLINAKKFSSNQISIGAQSGYWIDNGNYTSQISIKQIADENIEWIMLGHSEDIKYNNLSIENINNQIQKAIENNLKIVLCFGDETYESNIVKRINILVEKLLKLKINEIDLSNIVLAYEPIFAIGGDYQVNVNEIIEIITNIKEYFFSNFGINLSIIYGGSVNNKNFNSLYNSKILDGVLIGSYAWNIENICQIEEDYE